MDIFAEAEGDFAALYGLSAPVQHLKYERLAEILGLLSDFTPRAGGGVVNVARIAACLGVSSGFIGAVGSRHEAGKAAPDHFAALFEEELSADGLRLRLSRSSKPTGVFLLLKNAEGESRIAVAPSAALDLREEDIPEESLREARVVVLDSCLLGREGLVRRVLELADRYGTVIALDLASVETARSRAEEILGYCRKYPLILFMNEAEGEAFYEALGSPGAEEDGESPSPPGGDWRGEDARLRHSWTWFRELTAGDIYPIIVVKLGPRGSLVFAGGDLHRAQTMALIPLETTGAGDAFCAAFLAAWIQGKSLTECAGLGNRVAQELLKVPGAKADGKKLSHLAKLF